MTIEAMKENYTLFYCHKHKCGTEFKIERYKKFKKLYCPNCGKKQKIKYWKY